MRYPGSEVPRPNDIYARDPKRRRLNHNSFEGSFTTPSILPGEVIEEHGYNNASTQVESEERVSFGGLNDVEGPERQTRGASRPECCYGMVSSCIDL